MLKSECIGSSAILLDSVQGYIQKKSKGKSTFGIRNWKTRYITIDVDSGLLKIYSSAEEAAKGVKEKGTDGPFRNR